MLVQRPGRAFSISLGDREQTSHLKVWARNGFRQLIEQRLLHFRKLPWVHDLKYVFDLVEKHHLLRTIDLWPISKQPKYNLQSSVRSILAQGLINSPPPSMLRLSQEIVLYNTLIVGDTCSNF